ASIADSRSESDELRAAACMALARLGHAEVVSILAGIASKGSRGLGLLKATSPPLRRAAIPALGQVPTNAAGQEAPRKLVEDSDPNVQAVAREALYRTTDAATSTPEVHEVKPVNVKLAGSLQEVSVDQVCQLVGGSEKTGLLLLSLEGSVGRIWFEQGQ